jgi:hypothetical protein
MHQFAVVPGEPFPAIGTNLAMMINWLRNQAGRLTM